jgi:uncharacterized protein
MKAQLKPRANKIKPLLINHHKKPIDLGIERMSASINQDGLINSINTFHSTHGFITLTTMEQFPNDKWYESNYVRTYRKQMVEKGAGFGVKPLVHKEPEVFIDGKDPVFLYYFDSNNIEIKNRYTAQLVKGKEKIIQLVEIENKSELVSEVSLQLGGFLSLNRCSYGQLTEGGPILVPRLKNNLEIKGHNVRLFNENLSAQADLFFYKDNEPLELGENKETAEEPIQLNEKLTVEVAAGQTTTIKVIYFIREEKSKTTIQYSEIDSGIKINEEIVQNEVDPFEFSIKQNINYILSCCSISVSDEATCIITDHQLLPLSWNRDAYYMIKLLLKSVETEKYIYLKNEVQETVRSHIVWMFETAERPDGYWGRAYLTYGYCKDKVFQLDQQLYPLLELCEYYEQFGDESLVERVKGKIKDSLEEILTHKDGEMWLFETGETPADDKVIYPFHFSSQLLAWYTFKKLGDLNETFTFYNEDLHEWAGKIRKDCEEAFTAEFEGKPLFAYLTDTRGNYQFYHDANDFPTVLAPLWGFCESNDSRWKNTMEFAFSEKNEGGFYPGEFGGLGSVHTPHKWPLGDAQELLYAAVTEDTERVEAVQNKLKSVMLWDGMFSEAVNEKTGEVESRHWFSWPGAFISYVQLLLKKGMIQ